jgi:peptidoglycan/LPS O-acetylase OafA/YrhL
MVRTRKEHRLAKLESIRGFAAFYVVLHHMAREFLPHRWYRLPFVFGPEAVIVFFVLSGFVIFYSTSTNPLDLQLRNYSVKRVRRIYPIFLCALLLAYLSQAIVVRSLFVPSWKTLAGNLAMFQGISIDPFYDGPLWSLSYEWWFYVLFFLVITVEKVPGRRQFWAAGLSLTGLISAVIALNQASVFLLYFMVWWCGAELARQYLEEGRITWRKQAFSLGSLACLSVLSILLVLPAWRAHEPLSAIEFPVLFVRHLAAGVVLISVGIAWYKLRFVGFNRLLGGFSLLAPISYGIYVVHAPILQAVASFAPGQYAVPKIVLIWVLILATAYLLEIPFQSMINRWSKRLLVGKPKLNDQVGPALQPVAAT